eukprot:TRINITY_DN7402_c0_g1_i1.p1 TRINITY_DN7402_c0_g1~~TRINITY_DN7402_c0_g1_i1.p1  ORF type:complete len:735 (-),score=154.20 TRINITY_DN7402_c0_g1_i1:1631-3835(-)
MATPTEEGFLTEHQREVFTAELVDREPPKEAVKEPSGLRLQIEHASKHPAAVSRHHHVVNSKQERRSHSPRNGRPKKGGAGGKGTWGNPLLPYTDYDNSDPRDPNYDDGPDAYNWVPATPVGESLDDYRQKVVAIIAEYFTSGDLATVAADLAELGAPGYHHYFVKKLISMSLDHHDREKEMAASLLSALFGDVIKAGQMSKGFLRLLEGVEDLTLDCPDAVEVLALFVARAVVDDILPPAFVARTKKALAEGSKGAEVCHLAEVNLATPLHAERLERVWGGREMGTVEGAKEKIKRLLKEFVASGDAAEACRCIRDLNLPFFHHEVVKKALTAAMEEKETEEGRILSLLREAAEEGLISSNQMVKGFSRLHDALDDLVLDIPNARELLQTYVQRAIAQGWLPSSFAPAISTPNPIANGQGTHDGEVPTIATFKRKSEVMILEFFVSGDVEEVRRSLKELAFPDLAHLFVKKLITLAMDRHSREKEMASSLLSSLYPDVLPSDQVEDACTRLLEAVEDLALDIPDASNELSLFLARAVVDDILAPLYLAQTQELFKAGGGLASEVLQTTQAMLGARHAGERILRCWGGGAGRTVDDAKAKIVALLEEYEGGGDLAEACKCIRDLNLPFFHHEVVKKALVMAMEKRSERLLSLLKEGEAETLISSSQMIKGFQRTEAALPDLVLDVPDAVQRFESYKAKGQTEGWLSSRYSSPSLPATLPAEANGMNGGEEGGKK